MRIMSAGSVVRKRLIVDETECNLTVGNTRIVTSNIYMGYL